MGPGEGLFAGSTQESEVFKKLPQSHFKSSRNSFKHSNTGFFLASLQFRKVILPDSRKASQYVLRQFALCSQLTDSFSNSLADVGLHYSSVILWRAILMACGPYVDWGTP